METDIKLVMLNKIHSARARVDARLNQITRGVTKLTECTVNDVYIHGEREEQGAKAPACSDCLNTFSSSASPKSASRATLGGGFKESKVTAARISNSRVHHLLLLSTTAVVDFLFFLSIVHFPSVQVN